MADAKTKRLDGVGTAATTAQQCRDTDGLCKSGVDFRGFVGSTRCNSSILQHVHHVGQFSPPQRGVEKTDLRGQIRTRSVFRPLVRPKRRVGTFQRGPVLVHVGLQRGQFRGIKLFVGAGAGVGRFVAARARRPHAVHRGEQFGFPECGWPLLDVEHVVEGFRARVTAAPTGSGGGDEKQSKTNGGFHLSLDEAFL